MHICKRCIMDTTDLDITFDEYGICNHCRAYDEKKKHLPMNSEEGEEKLLRIIEKIKKDGEGKEYDCIIGLSGGVDSTYVAYLVKKRYGLRPLAVHLDNGWNSELSVKNINNTAEILDIDLYKYVIDWNEFKEMQLAYLKASVVDIEVLTDHAITALLYKMAKKYKTKYIISGANTATEGIMPKKWNYYKADSLNIKSINKRFGRVRPQTFPFNSLFNELFVRFVLNIKTIKILNYITYIKKDAIATIQNELKWEEYGGKHYESIFTKFYQAYILPSKFNIDKRKPHYSSLINSGQMTRDEALELMKLPLYPENEFEKEKRYVLSKLGLTDEQFEEIMKLPIKKHTDYPSYSKVFDFLRKMQKTLKQF